MPRIYDHEGENGVEYWFENGQINYQLGENNLTGHLHRDMFYDDYDRISIEDPVDKEWWVWWKGDTDPEQFDAMLAIASTIGTILLRNTPLSEIEALYRVAHAPTDADEAELDYLTNNPSFNDDDWKQLNALLDSSGE